ncbi:MAG: Ger(x)C family spore germination protein [Limnochordia bacterium]|jgi:spore germination protein KC
MRKILSGVCILAFCLAQTGCWDYLELETLSFVMAAGIDVGSDEGLTLTVETLEVKGGEPTDMSPYVTTTTGITLFNALRNVTNVSGKQMFFGHSHAVAFSEELARKGVGEAVGFMQRDVGVRTNMWLCVVRGSAAKDVFTADAPLGTSIGDYLNRVMMLQRRNPTFIPVQIWEFNRALNEVGLSPVLPAIEIIEIDDRKIPLVQGSGVFKRDRLIGWLDAQDSRVLSYLRLGKVTGVLATEMEYQGEKERIAAEVMTSRVELKPYWENDELSVAITVNLQVDLHELGFATFDYSRPELKRMAEEALARELKEDIERLIRTLQQDLKVDVVGFGALIKKKVPSAWRKVEKNWEEEFAQLPVSVRVAVLITGTGTLAKPLTGRP